MLLNSKKDANMNVKKCILILMTGLTLAGVTTYVQGCKKSENKVSKSKSDSIALCVKCGQIKGSELCCKPGQTKCSGCGLTKGSPGCCKIPKGATSAVLCSHCGQIKGSESCCKPNQATCSKCGLVKGSPGCCKIPK
jgi:hypothetical protein